MAITRMKATVIDSFSALEKRPSSGTAREDSCTTRTRISVSTVVTVTAEIDNSIEFFNFIIIFSLSAIEFQASSFTVHRLSGNYPALCPIRKLHTMSSDVAFQKFSRQGKVSSQKMAKKTSSNTVVDIPLALVLL